MIDHGSDHRLIDDKVKTRLNQDHSLLHPKSSDHTYLNLFLVTVFFTSNQLTSKSMGLYLVSKFSICSQINRKKYYWLENLVLCQQRNQKMAKSVNQQKKNYEGKKIVKFQICKKIKFN